LWNGDVYWDRPLGGHTEQNLGKIVQNSIYYPGYDATFTDGSVVAAVTDVWFKNGQEWAAILIEVAGLKNNNYFGIYKKGDPTYHDAAVRRGSGCWYFQDLHNDPLARFRLLPGDRNRHGPRRHVGGRGSVVDLVH
jgi:hypothetical protein